MVYLCKQAFNYPAGITALILSLWILQQTCHYQISHVSNSDSASERAAAGKQTQIEMDAAKCQHLVALFSCIVFLATSEQVEPPAGGLRCFLEK